MRVGNPGSMGPFLRGVWDYEEVLKRCLGV